MSSVINGYTLFGAAFLVFIYLCPGFIFYSLLGILVVLLRWVPRFSMKIQSILVAFVHSSILLGIIGA
jgi:hypothetical protein